MNTLLYPVRTENWQGSSPTKVRCYRKVRVEIKSDSNEVKPRRAVVRKGYGHRV